MNMLEEEGKVAMQQAEYDSWHPVRDEIDLFVPLSNYEDELALKATNEVEFEPGKFVFQGHLEL